VGVSVGVSIMRNLIVGAFLLTSLVSTAHAGSIQYLTQYRSVVATGEQAFSYINGSNNPSNCSDDYSDCGPQQPISAANFDEFSLSMTAEIADFDCFCITGNSAASQLSTLSPGGLAVSLAAWASQEDYGDSLLANASSIFEITFSLNEAASFEISGAHDYGSRYGAYGGASSSGVLLETLAGETIDLNWHTDYEEPPGDVSHTEQSLAMTINLDAGVYRLLVHSEKGLTGGYEYGASRYGSVDFAMTSVVPVPPALLLFPSALAVLGWLRRKQTV
jgi:hypothetical protein